MATAKQLHDGYYNLAQVGDFLGLSRTRLNQLIAAVRAHGPG